MTEELNTNIQMDKCCTNLQTPRPRRRINGLQLPLNYLQMIGWIVFLATALINFMILIEIQFKELKLISLVTYVVLYVSHVASHVTALLTDPSEKDLRKMKVNNVPEFDRSVHAHVIENGRCHLCNIYTSSKSTKHCSLCNKCVDNFDHHCKWLNNCVGQRNYAAFITCVATALLISLFTCSLCFADIVLFLTYPQQLSSKAQNYVNCTVAADATNVKYCRNSITFVTFLIILCVSAFAIGCALLHLCCFHIYISILGVSTYEYIVNSGPLKTSRSRHNDAHKCCTLSRRFYILRNYKKKNKQPKPESIETELNENTNPPSQTGEPNSSQRNNETNVGNIITILIANEIDRAKKMFFYDKNKVHPQPQNENS